MPSISRKGNCWGSAVAESFFATLKNEESIGVYRIKADAHTAIASYIFRMEKKRPARRPSRYELSQTQWERIADLLPGKASDPGFTACDNRLFVDAVLWVLCSGARWSDLSPRYGPTKACISGGGQGCVGAGASGADPRPR